MRFVTDCAPAPHPAMNATAAVPDKLRRSPSFESIWNSSCQLFASGPLTLAKSAREGLIAFKGFLSGGVGPVRGSWALIGYVSCRINLDRKAQGISARILCGVCALGSDGEYKEGVVKLLPD